MNAENKILLALVFLGLTVFAFNLLFLPNWSFVDASTHLRVVQRMLSGEPFELVAGDLFPFWYFVTAGFFSVFSFIPRVLWSHVWALVVFLPSLALMYSISKRLFSRHWLFALGFFLGNWWVLNFSSIAYIEPFLGLQVLLFFWLYLREKSSEGNSHLNYFSMLAVVLSLALTKLTGLALAPLLFFLMLFLFWRKTRSWQYPLLCGFGFFLAVFSFSKFLLNDSKAVFLVGLVQSTLWQFGRFLLNPFGWMPKFRELIFAVLNFPPNKCLNQLWFGANLELVQGIFFYLFLPLVLCAVFGFWNALKGKKPEWIAIALTTLLGFGIVLSQWLARTTYILPRYTIPVWGLLGLVFTKGYTSLKSEKLKKVVFASLALYCIYSFAYTGFSTYRYWKTEQAFEPGLNFVESMPSGNFAVSYVPSHRIDWFEGKEAIGGWQTINLNDLNRLGQQFKEKKIDFVFIGCYREQFSPTLFHALADRNRAKLLYKDNCSQVWRVQDYNFAIDSKELIEEITKPKRGGGTSVVGAPSAVDECH